MKPIGVVSLSIVGLVTISCTKSAQVARPTERQMEYGREYQAPPDEPIWTQAWDSVVEGAQEVAEAGEWTVAKAKGGAIVVWRATKQVAGKVGEEVSDATVLSAVKTRLAANPRTDALDINVDVDEGVVELRGNVSSRAEASEAVRTALTTRGVDRVISYLKWPVSTLEQMINE